MMGILPETSRLRTSVCLVIILLIGICFLGFTYWTQLNHSQSYQRKIAFLERTISKMSKAEDEADGREADFQRELRKHKQGLQHMNAMAHQEMMRLKYECTQNQDLFTQTIEEKNAVIKEKEDLMSNMKQAYLKMQQDMAVFQKNQSQLLEKFTEQSEKMEMLVRLKDKCYSQMNSISKRISDPSLPSDGDAAGRSSKTQDEGSREQPEGRREAVNNKADPPTLVPVTPPPPPSAVRIPIPPLKILDQFKGQFTDTVKGRDTNSETPKNVAPPPTEVKGNDQLDVLKPNDKEEKKKKQEPMDEEVNEAVERKQTTQPLNAVPDVLKPYDKEKKKEQEQMDEEVNEAVERKQPIQPPNAVPDVLKPYDKEKKKEQDPMDEKVNEAVKEKDIDQPPADEPDIAKSNSKLKAKKEEELKDWNAKAAVKEKQQAQPLEDELDLLQPNKKEEAKNEEEPF